MSEGLGKIIRASRIGAFLFEMLETFVIALAMVVVLYLFIASPHEVIGQSMEVNFKSGQYLIANKFEYRFHEPKRGDVIIFRHTESADFIKRVIGLPGETVSLKGGRIYINNTLLDEPYLTAVNQNTAGGIFLEEGESVTVPESSLFVVGDNRNNSSDSRTWGFLNYEDIKGKAWLIYWPISDFMVVPKQEYDI